LTGEGLFAPIFSSDEILAAVSDAAWLQALLDAEAGLARAEADCGVIPVGAADAIAATCQASRFDPGTLGRAARPDGNPVIPLVAALRAEVPPTAASWVHWGATSQDILDTAAMLVAARAAAPIDAALTRAAASCAGLARAHAELVMAGRTLLQQALPITFGLKAAGWLIGLDDARAQLDIARSRLAVQLGGAAGTLASLGSAGPAVLHTLARRLDLAEPVLPWHSSRQRVSGLAGALGTVAGTAAKICTDVVLLAQNEVGEVTGAASGGSSALPHKRNPATAVSVLAASRRALALVPVLQAGVVAEHERAVGGWQAEWESLSQLLALAGGAAAGAAQVVAGLEIHPAAMAANLAASGGLLLAERVTLTVAARTGNQAEARRAVTQAVEVAAGQGTGSATGQGTGFADALSRDPLVSSVLSPAQIDELLDPAGYLGASAIWIERALAAHDRETDRADGP
jgi:3-carboxy-cis,cis-muconate cycloisomerase